MSQTGNWFTPTTVGAGNAYYIRFTNAGGSGTLNGGPLGTWLSLSSNQSIGINRLTIPGSGVRQKDYLVEISTSSSGPALVTETVTVISDYS
jgi:hypothetical protein